MAFENHPAAEIFPMLDFADLNQLADDIKKNGLLEPIIMYHGQVLDGRNRLAACEIAGVEPHFVEMNGNLESPVLYVISRNLHRRHLSVSQRACIAAEMVPMLREEAEKRQLSGKRDDTLAPSGAKVDDERSGRSAAIAARAVGVGETSVTRAVKAKRENPEGFEKVKRGELSVTAAADGHTERPATGGDDKIPISSNKGQINANAQKRRMESGLSTLSGLAAGLDAIDLEKVRAVSTQEELREWAEKTRQAANRFRSFAAQLEGKK